MVFVFRSFSRIGGFNFLIKWDQAISASVAALSQLLQLSTRPFNCQRTFIDIFGKKTFRKKSLIFTPPQFFCLKLSRTNFHSSEPFIAKENNFLLSCIVYLNFFKFMSIDRNRPGAFLIKFDTVIGYNCLH